MPSSKYSLFHCEKPPFIDDQYAINLMRKAGMYDEYKRYQHMRGQCYEQHILSKFQINKWVFKNDYDLYQFSQEMFYDSLNALQAKYCELSHKKLQLDQYNQENGIDDNMQFQMFVDHQKSICQNEIDSQNNVYQNKKNQKSKNYISEEKENIEEIQAKNQSLVINNQKVIFAANKAQNVVSQNLPQTQTQIQPISKNQQRQEMLAQDFQNYENWQPNFNDTFSSSGMDLFETGNDLLGLSSSCSILESPKKINHVIDQNNNDEDDVRFVLSDDDGKALKIYFESLGDISVSKLNIEFSVNCQKFNMTEEQIHKLYNVFTQRNVL